MPALADDLSGTAQIVLAAAFGALTILGIVLMAPSAKKLKATGGPGIVALELAGSDDKVRVVLAQWGTRGRKSAAQNLAADLPFLVGYGGLLAVLLSSGADTIAAKTWSWTGTASRALALLAIAAAVLDLIENACLWRVVTTTGSVQPTAAIAKIAAYLKFALVIVAVVWLALVVVPILLVPAGVS